MVDEVLVSVLTLMDPRTFAGPSSKLVRCTAQVVYQSQNSASYGVVGRKRAKKTSSSAGVRDRPESRLGRKRRTSKPQQFPKRRWLAACTSTVDAQVLQHNVPTFLAASFALSIAVETYGR